MLSRVASCRPSSNSLCSPYRHVTTQLLSLQWQRFKHEAKYRNFPKISPHNPSSFKDNYNSKNRKIISKLFATRQFTILDVAPGTTTKEEILDRVQKTFDIDHKNRALVVLATPRYASWLEDDVFMARLVAKTLSTMDERTSFEASVLVAVVDGLAPSFDNIPYSNNRTPKEGFSLLEGRTGHILPGFWDPPNETEDSSNNTQSCITFGWQRDTGTVVEFNHIQACVRAFNAIKDETAYPDLEANYERPWYEYALSSEWTSDRAEVNPDKEKEVMRAVILEGLPTNTPISDRDIAHIARGALLEKIVYEPGSIYAFLRFARHKDAADFVAWSKQHPEKINIGGKLLVAHLRAAPQQNASATHILEHGASRGLRITKMPASWSTKDLMDYLSKFGRICDDTTSVETGAGVQNSPGGLHDLSVTMPLANTLFINGRYSTLLATRWEVKGYTAKKLKGIEKKHQVVSVNIPATRNLPQLIESHRAIPLTIPRRIVSGLGNIIRELDFDGEGHGPASRELETNVAAYLKADSKPPRPENRKAPPNGTIRIWALIVPPSLQQEFFRSSPEKLRFASKDFWRSTAFYKENKPRALLTSAVDGKPLGYWISRGARFCRVLSGGGGWGAKQGLLSLDPQISHTDITEEARYDYSLGTTVEDQTSALGEVALPGSIIQFFTSSPIVARRKDVWGSPRSLFSKTTVFGTVPSTIDNMPTESKPQNAKKHQLILLPGLFGAVSESGLFLNHKTKHNTLTKFDLPYTYVAQESISNFGVAFTPSKYEARSIKSKPQLVRKIIQDLKNGEGPSSVPPTRKSPRFVYKPETNLHNVRRRAARSLEGLEKKDGSWTKGEPRSGQDQF